VKSYKLKDIRHILRVLNKLFIIKSDYSNALKILRRYDVTEQDKNFIIQTWLIETNINCCIGAIGWLYIWNVPVFTQVELFKIALTANKAETWKRVFDLANTQQELKDLASPINLFSKGVKASNTSVWRNIFRSGFHYHSLNFQSMDIHLAGWKLIVQTGKYTYQELFDLWTYTGHKKSIMMEIFKVLKLSNQELANFGNKSDCWKDIFLNSLLTTDLDKLRMLEIPRGLGSLIETGCIADVSKLIEYGREVDTAGTWIAILASERIKDVTTISGIINKFPSCATTAIRCRLTDDMAVILKWASTSQEAWRYLHERLLTKDDFPLPLNFVNL
jgi:hypothetical protein